MTYAENYALAYVNLDFRGRISMCVAQQAKIFTNDGRAEFYELARAAIADNRKITDQFLPLIATEPGVTDQSDDAQLLSAVQALWPVMGAGYVTTP